MSEPFIGEIRVVGFGFAPRGWAPCNGQLLAIAQNQALFSILGTTYGGDGRTTFALPNLQGHAALNAGQGPGLSNYALGESGGNGAVTLQANQLPAHTHQAMGNSAAGGANTPQSNVWAASAQGDNWYAPGGDATMNPGAIAPAGGGQPHDNMQPSLSVMFIIALVGIYPPRD
jgi:microcystin-dependent protein